MTTEVVSVPEFSDEQLGNIKSFDDAIALLGEAGVVAVDIAEYGDGFKVMDKKEFVGRKFLILDYKFKEGDYLDDDGNKVPFVIIRLIDERGNKAIITDGGTGICKQMIGLYDRGIHGSIICQDGLIRSEYEWTDHKGQQQPGETFYLAQ